VHPLPTLQKHKDVPLGRLHVPLVLTTPIAKRKSSVSLETFFSFTQDAQFAFLAALTTILRYVV
jgi:hypothetical protein